MASAIVRSTLRTALRGGQRVNPVASKRSFSSGASVEEEAREAAKWEKITYVGIVACSILAIVNLSKGHPHFEEPPAYPYMHIRNKEFPWGPDGLFEVKEHH
ncbi:cytochrome c oxidase subunit 6a, mitochondrial-like [Rutidosis leptorrhynchoides]|uniref:cytochrome c oxidase subunit 6a, mitochondrial-like n=1 Tax=Rutidosis leptorrhynchoides TaxID=125765 RepID=UPI003A998998